MYCFGNSEFEQSLKSYNEASGKFFFKFKLHLVILGDMLANTKDLNKRRTYFFNFSVPVNDRRASLVNYIKSVFPKYKTLNFNRDPNKK